MEAGRPPFWGWHKINHFSIMESYDYYKSLVSLADWIIAGDVKTFLGKDALCRCGDWWYKLRDELYSQKIIFPKDGGYELMHIDRLRVLRIESLGYLRILEKEMTASMLNEKYQRSGIVCGIAGIIISIVALCLSVFSLCQH